MDNDNKNIQFPNAWCVTRPWHISLVILALKMSYTQVSVWFEVSYIYRVFMLLIANYVKYSDEQRSLTPICFTKM